MTTEIVGTAVLRNYPVRLWHRQFAYNQELLREFQLLVAGQALDGAHSDVPARLLSMADMFISRYGRQMDALTAARQEAYDAGLMTIDSLVPLPAETMEIIPAAVQMLAEVDEYCRKGELLTLGAPPDIAAFQSWTTSELISQFQGNDPVPWSGPLE